MKIVLEQAYPFTFERHHYVLAASYNGFTYPCSLSEFEVNIYHASIEGNEYPDYDREVTGDLTGIMEAAQKQVFKSLINDFDWEWESCKESGGYGRDMDDYYLSTQY